MIEPFEPNQVRQVNGQRIVSYGTSSYGYDIRCSDEFKLFTNINSTIVDPKNFDEKSFVDVNGDVCIIPPNSFALARTVEYFRIPRNVLTICLGKSTYARCGIIVNVTPFEPEWEGYVTLEFSNTTPLPAKIYANEGVAQVIFFESDPDDVCETSYQRPRRQVPGAAGRHAAQNLGRLFRTWPSHIYAAIQNPRAFSAGGPSKESRMKFHFPVVIIDEDFRSENTSGLGIRALAKAIEDEGIEVIGVTSYGDLSPFAQQQSRASAFILSIDDEEFAPGRKTKPRRR